MRVRLLGAGVCLAVVGGLLTGCAIFDPGDATTEERPIEPASSVVFDGAGSVNIRIGGTPSVTVTAGDAVIDNIYTDSSNGVLKIGRDGWFPFGIGVAEYEIVVPELHSVTVNGAADVTADFSGANKVAIVVDGAATVHAANVGARTVDLDLSGAGTIDSPSMSAESVAATISGAGVITLDGTTEKQTIAIDGGGAYHAGDLASRSSAVTIDGAAKVDLDVSSSLKATIDGAGVVTYKGNPDVEEHVSGLGTVRRVAS